MGLLKTLPDNEEMKKYLTQEHIEPILKKHCGELSIPYQKIRSFNSKHIKLLSAQSYLVKYDVEVVTYDGLKLLVLRGNRISNDAATMWQYLFDESIKAGKKVVPTPIEYFPKDNFMLYEEFAGLTLRDFDNKFTDLQSVTPSIAEHIAWIHSLPANDIIAKQTKEEEKIYWDSVKEKIQTHLPEKPDWINDLLNDVHTQITSRMDTQLMTLCHNDYQASNLIYDENKKRVGVIDFGNSTIFTPSIDIATYLVHLSVMTTKHLSQDQIHTLQRLFLNTYLELAPDSIKKQILKELPLHITRIALDIIATTAVALTHTENPYRILIPKILLPLVKEKMELLDRSTNTIEDCIITLNK